MQLPNAENNINRRPTLLTSPDEMRALLGSNNSSSHSQSAAIAGMLSTNHAESSVSSQSTNDSFGGYSKAEWKERIMSSKTSPTYSTCIEGKHRMLDFAVQDNKPSVDTIISIIETYGGEKSFKTPPLHYVVIECGASIGLVRKLLRRGSSSDSQAQKYFSPQRLDCCGDSVLFSLWKRARACHGIHLDFAGEDERQRIMDLTTLLIDFETDQDNRHAICRFISDFNSEAGATSMDTYRGGRASVASKRKLHVKEVYSMDSFLAGTIFAS